MAEPPSSRPRRRVPPVETSYWTRSRKPLQILGFLLPLIVAYELGLALLLRSDDGVVVTNKAHESLLMFFSAFGVSPAGSLYIGGLVIVVVLLVWHLLTRDPWTFDWRTAGLMAVESLGLTLPLLVLARVISQELAPATAPTPLADLSIWSKMAISVGAGLYEELMFRMLLIAVVHTLLVDVGKISNRVGASVAVLVSAIAFTVYHPLRDASGALAGANVVFYFAAGLYFGAVYILRGFGIVVAVHALYDVIVVSLHS